MSVAREWVAIPEHQGCEVSNDGRVRNRGRELSRHPNPAGYPTVRLPGRRTARVHRLVLEAFVAGSLPGMTCNHRNGDPADNRVGNLEWVPIDVNLRHAALLRRHKRGHPSMKGRP